MKFIYILIVLVVAALTLGCIGNKPAEPLTNAPVAPVEAAPATTPSIDDPFGTDLDVASLDAMLADSSMNISLTESI